MNFNARLSGRSTLAWANTILDRAPKARGFKPHTLTRVSIEPTSGEVVALLLNGLKSLLYIFNRDLRPFSEKRTNFHLLGPIEALVKTWGLKPLAFGALSRMRYAQAKIKRPDKRALKVKFMFDPHLISNPEIWLSDCTGLEVEVEYLSPAQDAPTHRAKQDQPKMNSGFDAKAKAPVA